MEFGWHMKASRSEGLPQFIVMPVYIEITENDKILMAYVGAPCPVKHRFGDSFQFWNPVTAVIAVIDVSGQ